MARVAWAVLVHTALVASLGAQGPDTTILVAHRADADSVFGELSRFVTGLGMSLDTADRARRLIVTKAAPLRTGGAPGKLFAFRILVVPSDTGSTVRFSGRMFGESATPVQQAGVLLSAASAEDAGSGWGFLLRLAQLFRGPAYRERDAALQPSDEWQQGSAKVPQSCRTRGQWR